MNILTAAQQRLVDGQIPENRYAMASFLTRRMDTRVLRRDEHSERVDALPFMLVVAEQPDFVIGCCPTEASALELASSLGLPVRSRVLCGECHSQLADDEVEYLGHICNACERAIQEESREDLSSPGDGSLGELSGDEVAVLNAYRHAPPLLRAAMRRMLEVDG